MKKQPVVHFEMPYKDAKRVSAFYETVFGWGMNGTGAEMGNYILAETTETDKNRMVQTPGTINGGFYPIGDAPPEASVVIEVTDLNASMDMVKKSGGQILKEPEDIPGIGRWVSIRDTEGNRLSMMQTLTK